MSVERALGSGGVRARNVVKARERDQDEMKDVAAEADRDAPTRSRRRWRRSGRRSSACRWRWRERRNARRLDCGRTLRCKSSPRRTRVPWASWRRCAELAEEPTDDSLRAQIDAKSEALTGARADLVKAEAEIKALSDSKADVDALRTLNTTLLHQIKTLAQGGMNR